MRKNSKTESCLTIQLGKVACQLFHSGGLSNDCTVFENNNSDREPTGFGCSALARGSITVKTQARSISEYFQCLIETGIIENFEYGESW